MKKVKNSKFTIEKFEVAKLKSLISFRGGDSVGLGDNDDVMTITFTKSGSSLKCGGDTTSVTHK